MTVLENTPKYTSIYTFGKSNCNLIIQIHFAMPPKIDAKTLTGKINNVVRILYELMEEFETVFSVKPGPERLETVFI